jgi:hypothetical protein
MGRKITIVKPKGNEVTFFNATIVANWLKPCLLNVFVTGN